MATETGDGWAPPLEQLERALRADTRSSDRLRAQAAAPITVLGVRCTPHADLASGVTVWRGVAYDRSVHAVHYDRAPEPWSVSILTRRGGVPAVFTGAARDLDEAAERAEFRRVMAEGES